MWVHSNDKPVGHRVILKNTNRVAILHLTNQLVVAAVVGGIRRRVHICDCQLNPLQRTLAERVHRQRKHMLILLTNNRSCSYKSQHSRKTTGEGQKPKKNCNWGIGHLLSSSETSNAYSLLRILRKRTINERRKSVPFVEFVDKFKSRSLLHTACLQYAERTNDTIRNRYRHAVRVCGVLRREPEQYGEEIDRNRAGPVFQKTDLVSFSPAAHSLETQSLFETDVVTLEYFRRSL